MQAERLVSEKIRDDIKENMSETAEKIISVENSQVIKPSWCGFCRKVTRHQGYRCMRCS